MIKKAYNILIICSLFWLSACESDVTVELPLPENRIVVNGHIETGGHPMVLITKNIPYFDTLSQEIFANILIQDAEVTVSDGVTTDSLKFGFFPDLFPPAGYRNTNMVGEAGKRYELKIRYNGKTYQSYTYIPKPVAIDSLVFKPEKPNDSLGYIWIHYTDPDTVGNYYRIFTKTIGLDEFFTHPFSSVWDDKIINGKTIEYPLYRGLSNAERQQQRDSATSEEEFRANFMFKRGQTVVIKLSPIDMQHFLFWQTIERQMAGQGNPFAAPATPRTNISNGALGIWGGYGVYTDTIAIPIISIQE